MIDYLASSNRIHNTSCKSKETIQDGFISTGEISRTRNSKGMNSCLDLYQIIKCTKNKSILENRDAYFNQDSLYEKQFDVSSLCKDSYFNNNTCELHFTDNQYDLMKSIVPYHFNFRKNQMIGGKKLYSKKIDNIKKI